MVKETVIVQSESSSNMTALIKRGYMSLEDKEWYKANDFFKRVLNHDAECAEAYLRKTLVEVQTNSLDSFKGAYVKNQIAESNNIRRARQFANAEQSAWWQEPDETLKTNEQRIRKEQERQKEEQKRKIAEIRQQIKPVQGYISSGESHIAGICADGTVIAMGQNDYGQCNINEQKDIVSAAHL